MLTVLQSILHGVLDLPYLAVNLLIDSFNGWMLALTALAGALFAILPGFPPVPTLPAEVLAGIAWFLPVAAMLAVFGTFVVAFVVWLGVQVALRWVKAL